MQSVAYIYFISDTFVTYGNFSELIRKISPTYIFLIYILSHHKIPVPIGLNEKVFLMQHQIEKSIHNVDDTIWKTSYDVMITIALLKKFGS